MLRRPIITPIVVGLLLAGGLRARRADLPEVPFLTGLTEDVIGYARYGHPALVVVIIRW